MKHVADYYRVYFILIVILSGGQSAASAQDSLPYPVILSSRWFHPTSPQDTLSTIKMVDLYHPDRVDWMYCTNADQLAQLTQRNIPYSLAINPQVPDSLEYTVKGRVVDINGEKLVAPWMQNWKQKNANWGCVNSPEFRKVFINQSHKLIDLGAYGLFVDDARFNDHVLEWGGCFCEYCMAGFAKYLQAETVDSLGADFNYRDYLHKHGISIVPVKGNGQNIPLWSQFQRFQTQSVIQFLKSWRNNVKTYAKRPVAFLTNNYSGSWTEIYQVFDIGIAELPENLLERNYILSRTLEATKLDKKQYFSLSSDDENKQLKAIFLTYLANSALIVPWDIYVHLKSQIAVRRYFGKINIFQPAYELFQQDKKYPSGYTSNKQGTYEDIPIKIDSQLEGDSIKIYKYKYSNGKIFFVESSSHLKKHIVKISNLDKSTKRMINVLYPITSSVKNKEKQKYITFQENTLIFSLK